MLAVRLPEKAETSCLHACVFGRARLNCGVLVRKQVEGSRVLLERVNLLVCATNVGDIKYL